MILLLLITLVISYTIIGLLDSTIECLYILENKIISVIIAFLIVLCFLFTRIIIMSFTE
jgi:hypothetical protein